MRIETFLASIGAALLAAVAVSGGEPSRPSDPPMDKTASAPARGYDEIFGEILQNLPDGSRAKVDSARSRAEAPGEPKSPPASSERPDAERSGSRDKALEKLAPEVKDRVEKAIRELETKRREREMEFRESGK